MEDGFFKLVQIKKKNCLLPIKISRIQFQNLGDALVRNPRILKYTFHELTKCVFKYNGIRKIKMTNTHITSLIQT